MSSAFTPFPTNGIVPTDGPPPRKMVEYSTGVVVSADGAIVTDRHAVDGCLSIVVPAYGNADRVAQDKTHDLALLRIYGASELKPLAMAAGTDEASRDDHRHCRPAEPGRRRGGLIESIRRSRQPAAAAIQRCSPRQASALSGGAAVDGDRHFAGIALLKPPVVAGGQGSRRRHRLCWFRPMRCANS